MGLSRRATTRPQHHLTTHPLSHDDDDDDNDPINHYSQSATSRRDSSLGLVIRMVCVVMLTATAAIRSYSVLLMSLSSYKSESRSIVADETFHSNHVIPANFSGNDMLVSIKKHDEKESAPETTAATMAMAMMIPRRLIFTHKSNILEPTEQRRISMHEMRFQQNILNTIEQYQSAWKAIDEEKSSNISTTTNSNSNNSNAVQVWFLDNGDCEAAIQRVEPELVQHFREEERGDYKADICRIAALYLHGGYYFDIDMRVISPLVFEGGENSISSNISFSTAVMAARDGFFQSFLASTASNPILRASLKIMLEWYKNKAVLRVKREETLLSDEPSGRENVSDAVEERRNSSKNLHGIDPALWVISRRGLIGPVSLKFAYERVMLNSSSSFEGSSSVTTSGNQKAFILQEDDLSANPHRELFPNLVRQEGDGCCCNYVIHGPAPSFIGSSNAAEQGQNTTPYFFSRIVGAGEYCHWKGGVGAWVRSHQQQKQSPTYALFKPF